MSWLSSTSIYERRRLVVAAMVTLLALPALWWSQRDHPIAAASVEAAGVAGALGGETGALGNVGAIPPGAPGFLSGPRESAPATVPKAAGPPPQDASTKSGLGTYKQLVHPIVGPRLATSVPTSPLGLCVVAFLPEGARITVENTDNGKAVTCLTRAGLLPDGMTIVLDTSLFLVLSDPRDAPVPVRIRW